MAGRAVAYEGHCWTREQRDRLRAIAAAHGAPTILIFLDLPEEIVRARWRANRADPRRHDVRDDDFARAIALLEPPVAGEGAVVYTGEPPPEVWVARLRP